ncbi:VCBS repeat-containing protein [Kovacikia minuta CCNUW1]|uniref:FG-GAP repeat domain-containing protein n=1 Tax=Kovacikia minuta TaxID=2931930 RepID=UPI001CCBFC2D|nr:VCBS repeat-containing protein [Kovacikia minuta]UBF28133.1 VCBS repeat-containing protein [Kovacikia minuta CCNUW1]
MSSGNSMATGYSTAFALPTLKDTNWQIEGTADFTGDGRADVLWRNYSTGANVVWQLNGTSYSTAFTLPTLKDSNWRIEGVADFTGDGKADILWRHYGNGANVIWQMNGTSYSTAFTLPTQSADWSLWSLAKVADFTGDGKDDLLWRNSTTGANVIWQLNGTSYSTSYALPTLKGVSMDNSRGGRPGWQWQ